MCASDNGTLLKSVYLNPQNTLREKSVSFQPNGSGVIHMHTYIHTYTCTQRYTAWLDYKNKNVFSCSTVVA